MELLSVEVFEEGNREILFNSTGLSEDDQKLIRDIALGVFEKAQKISKIALKRRTFFADDGYKALSEVIREHKKLNRPRIEGCDTNPFDQHYWVACDLVTSEGQEAVIFDPIFKYVGL